MYDNERTLSFLKNPLLSQDPIGFAGDDANLYRYVWNQPTKYVDLEGELGGLALAFTPPASSTPAPSPSSSPGDFLVPVSPPILLPMRPKDLIPVSSGPRGQSSPTSGPSCG